MSDKYQNFVSYLGGLERAAFAKVRRSLSDETSMEAIPYLERWTVGESTWNRSMFYLLAGLYCLYERPLEGKPEERSARPGSHKENLGVSMAELYLAKDRSSSVEHRFVTLLDADAEQLPYRLRQMVTLLRSSDVAIGWEKLLGDLLYWRTSSRSVQHAWARSFYQKSDPMPPGAAPSSDDPTPSDPLPTPEGA